MKNLRFLILPMSISTDASLTTVSIRMWKKLVGEKFTNNQLFFTNFHLELLDLKDIYIEASGTPCQRVGFLRAIPGLHFILKTDPIAWSYPESLKLILLQWNEKKMKAILFSHHHWISAMELHTHLLSTGVTFLWHKPLTYWNQSYKIELHWSQS